MLGKAVDKIKGLDGESFVCDTLLSRGKVIYDENEENDLSTPHRFKRRTPHKYSDYEEVKPVNRPKSTPICEPKMPARNCQQKL